MTIPSRRKRVVAAHVGLTIATVWAALAAFYAVKRYGCSPLQFECREEFWRRFEDFILLQWLDAWQTLTSGVLALAAAAVGAWFLSKQIGLADRHETDRVARGHASARAALSFNLDYLWRHEESVAAWLREQLAHISLGTLTSAPPRLDQQMVASLERMIANSSKLEVEPYAELISLLQVQSARLHGHWAASLSGDPPGLVELLDRCYDAIEAAARINALFPYARFSAGADCPRTPERSDITNARSTIGFREHQVSPQTTAGLNARIDRRWPTA